jgi:hypothetical protein
MGLDRDADKCIYTQNEERVEFLYPLTAKRFVIRTSSPYTCVL